MIKIRGFLYRIYDLILNNPLCTAVVLFCCLLLKLNIQIIVVITFIMAVLSVLSFNKRYSFLQSFIFAVYFFLFEVISVYFVMQDTMFAPLTLFLHGFFIFAAILLRTLSVFLTYALTNIFLFKIINIEKIKNYTINFVNLFRQESFILVLTCVLVLFFSLHYSIKYFQTVPVKITSFSKLKGDYFYGFGNKIYPLNSNKLCFMKKNQIIIYDLKNHKIYDKYTLLNFDNIFLSNTVIDVRTENRIFPLSNGNILIQRNYIPQKRKDYNYTPKTYIKIYAPKKGELASLEIPFMHNSISLTEIRNNKVFFIDNKEKQAFIYDMNNNTFNRKTELNVERYGEVKTILLNDKRLFIFGGQNYPNNYAEIYDFSKDSFERIPLNFNVHNYINTIKLTMLNDGRVLIQCEKANENEKDGIGNSHGFRTQDGKFLTVYPVPYLTIFNPKDNSFEEIDINKNSNKIRVKYDTAVLKNGNIIIAGGGYIDKSLITKNKRKRMKNTQDILVYNPKTHTIKRTFKDLKYNHYGYDILTVLNDETVLVLGNIYNVPNDKNQIEALRFKK